MRELEQKRAIEKKEIARIMAAYLQSRGKEAHLSEESNFDSCGGKTKESVIALIDDNINEIRLLNTFYELSDNAYRFDYNIITDRPFTPDLKKAMNVRSKVVKANKQIGLFGGDVVDITWSGNELAEKLNGDTELSKLVVESINNGGTADIRILAVLPSTVEILGPAFIGSLLTDSAEQNRVIKIFGLEIYSRIAGHIRELIVSLTSQMV